MSNNIKLLISRMYRMRHLQYACRAQNNLTEVDKRVIKLYLMICLYACSSCLHMDVHAVMDLISCQYICFLWQAKQSIHLTAACIRIDLSRLQ